MNPDRRYTIWQCSDWCCEEKPHADKWWNVSRRPGDYRSVRTWGQALTIATNRWWT